MKKILSEIISKTSLVVACSSTVLLTACGGDGAKNGSNTLLDSNEDGRVVVVLQDDPNDVELGPVIISNDPATEGAGLFVRQSDPDQHIAGFEFCCGKFDTYQNHEFTNATGDFAKLDGGWWGGDVAGNLGDRVFSSFGDGFLEDGTSLGWIGFSATGTIESPEFEITDSYINFLIGGGENGIDRPNTTAVALVVDGEIVRQSSGKNLEFEVAWDAWDVRTLKGRTAKILFIDNHPDDNSDTAVPYLLADEFRIANSAAVQPAPESVVKFGAKEFTNMPELEGTPAFIRKQDPNQNIAGFEFCCGGFGTYGIHNFNVTGDMQFLDGGWWAADVVNSIGERAFSSRADGKTPTGVSLGWIGDDKTGTLATPSFEINANYINFLIGGGTNPYMAGSNRENRTTAMVLRVNGKVVRQATGNGLESQVDWKTWDVSSLIGETAVIEIIDFHDASIDDGSLPFLLVDEIRSADKAAAIPESDSLVIAAEGHAVGFNLNMIDPNPIYIDGTYYLYHLQNFSFHSWGLTKTKDLLSASFPIEVLSASGDGEAQDQFLGSGSVVRDHAGKYHLFSTGHNQNLSPKEVVLHAIAADSTLTRWIDQPDDTFSADGGYSSDDFRDPKVFWNEEADQYWMLLTSRYAGEAAIALYTSTDLSTWVAADPLYTENSNLNLEVPDYFNLGEEGDLTPFLVYSDQRDGSRQVKYLSENFGVWSIPENDALDGKYFYAGRTAGDDSERLMFGWVADRNTRDDSGTLGFGGDLIAHQLTKSATGELKVSLPEKIRAGLQTVADTAMVSKSGDVTGDAPVIDLGANSSFALAAANEVNRLELEVSSSTAEAVFGIQFTRIVEKEGEMVEERVAIQIDAQDDEAEFFFDAGEPSLILEEPELQAGNLWATNWGDFSASSFQQCCYGGDNAMGAWGDWGYQEATGDMILIDGGQWAGGGGADVIGAHDDRIFRSFGDQIGGGFLGWEITGSVTTPKFTITKDFINFLIGGGSNPWGTDKATAIGLFIVGGDGNPVRTSAGDDTFHNGSFPELEVKWSAWDVSEFKGQEAYVVLVDNHDGDGSPGLPFLLADHFFEHDLPAIDLPLPGPPPTSAGLGLEDNPVVKVDLDTEAGVGLDLFLNPEVGIGTLYLDGKRALSFRLYDMKDYDIGLYTNDDGISIDNLVRFTK
ncbi:hypothetical protein G8764_03445 [Pseudomaricurvus alcaniphilus]|uniref:hypothetical protein n=1 Tax=Pseudomaricurvus alcaniphilus TaxID=1166482 RepID=UPI00140E7C70|nr:hypothetical protein [Pseudomaricurvus alcaniphilus]NHN36341.1 hypothetical protein [Pseudomaricurvus alcaniphilus]